MENKEHIVSGEGCPQWKNLQVRRKLIAKYRDVGHGVLISGPPEHSEKLARELASEQKGKVVVFRPEDLSEDELVQRLEELLDPPDQLDLLQEREFPIIVALDLHLWPKEAQMIIRRHLECHKVPWLCIATCRDINAISDSITSFFSRVEPAEGT